MIVTLLPSVVINQIDNIIQISTRSVLHIIELLVILAIARYI